MSQAYWALLEEVTETEGALSSAVLRMTVNSSPLDREHEISLKCSLMTALCAKTALHLLLPSHVESLKMSLDTGCQIITITEQIGDDGTLILPIKPSQRLSFAYRLWLSRFCHGSRLGPHFDRFPAPVQEAAGVDFDQRGSDPCCFDQYFPKLHAFRDDLSGHERNAGYLR